MKSKGKEVLEELQSVLTGKTLDAILPPILFILVKSFFGLYGALIGSFLLSTGFAILRYFKKQTLAYALGGMIGTSLTVLYAFISANAANYFIPGIVSNLFVLLLSIFTLIIDKPLAAFVSHLTRGWKLEWFWRKDIKPAYREVTWMWTAFFLMRSFIQITLFMQKSVDALVWANTLMGLPFTIAILVISYLYGIRRLHTLKGPGIDEFTEAKQAPFRGQTRGF
ncbi:MAG: DUF3159 domain-containing protein [Erysipelotrichaceae bacterium]